MLAAGLLAENGENTLIPETKEENKAVNSSNVANGTKLQYKEME